jgi:hypothetical protein
MNYDKQDQQVKVAFNFTKRPRNKNQWQGAKEDPKQKQDRAQGRAWTCLSLKLYVNPVIITPTPLNKTWKPYLHHLS